MIVTIFVFVFVNCNGDGNDKVKQTSRITVAKFPVTDFIYIRFYTGEIHSRMHRWNKTRIKTGQYFSQSQRSQQTMLCKLQNSGFFTVFRILNLIFFVFDICTVGDAWLWHKLGCFQYNRSDEFFQVYL